MGLTITSYIVCLYLYWTYEPVVYIFPVYTVYIHFSKIYLFLMQHECKILKIIVFGMVHSHNLAVVLLLKHFTSRHSTVFNSINITTNCAAHSGTVWKPFMGSIPDGVIKIFHCHNIAGCTMAMGST
jgi:hypothetical protein